MTIEIDVEVVMDFPPDVALQVQSQLADKFTVVAFQVSKKYGLKKIIEANSNLTVNQAIIDYLEGIEVVADIVVLYKGVLRVGVFFKIDDYDFFSAELGG